MMKATDIDQGIKDSIIASINKDDGYVKSPGVSPRAPLTSTSQESLFLESSSNSPRR